MLLEGQKANSYNYKLVVVILVFLTWLSHPTKCPFAWGMEETAP